ncbi:hypothetical protein [Nocardia brasiliensis]|uniref:hypothetical protein n=1 Tax=Nocardia brasiliensis TaxID=37326 RepID=UPI00189432AF|nr:hypothetical protein [Nocardia brasiliensis]MBF6125059.1 hypothetical protein [Nocardia brasiliensis]
MAGEEQVDPAGSTVSELKKSPSQELSGSARAEGRGDSRGRLGGLPGTRGSVSGSFEIRTVDGEEGERLAAVQAKAIAELLIWLRDHGTTGKVS